MVVRSAPFAGQKWRHSPISPRAKYPLFAGADPLIGPVNPVAGPKRSPREFHCLARYQPGWDRDQSSALNVLPRCRDAPK